MDEFPNNSSRAKQPPPDNEKHIEKIITGEVVTRKPSGFRRFRRSFIAGDASSVGDHVFWNLLVPAAQDAVLDMGTTFLEMLIKGERGSLRRGNPAAPQQGVGSTSKMNYGGISSGSKQIFNPGQGQAIDMSPAGYSPNEIYLRTRAEAEAVIGAMFEVLERYPVVTVRDLYAMVGRSATYADDRWGWTDLSNAGVRREGGAVRLVLPDPEEVK